MYGGGSNKKDSINNSLKGILDQNILVTYMKLTILKYNWLEFLKEQNNMRIRYMIIKFRKWDSKNETHKLPTNPSKNDSQKSFTKIIHKNDSQKWFTKIIHKNDSQKDSQNDLQKMTHKNNSQKESQKDL